VVFVLGVMKGWVLGCGVWGAGSLIEWRGARMGPAPREGRGGAGVGLWEAISTVKEEGVGAGGIFEKGLSGGNIDLGAAEGLIVAKGFEDFDSVEVDIVNVVGSVVEDVANVANVPGAVEVDDPSENGGRVVELNVGAFIDPNIPVPLVLLCGIPVDLPIPFYSLVANLKGLYVLVSSCTGVGKFIPPWLSDSINKLARPLRTRYGSDTFEWPSLLRWLSAPDQSCLAHFRVHHRAEVHVL
jgi:hypothetical protein